MHRFAGAEGCMLFWAPVDSFLCKIQAKFQKSSLNNVSFGGRKLGLDYVFEFFPVSEEEQETSGDFGSGGSVILLDDLEEDHEAAKMDKEGKQKIHVRAANDDDEDEDDDKDDEIGYIW